jgi:hypothetical protein
MAEPISPFDEANDYLLGRLTPDARRNFEARLATDAELRRLVRDLEEGVLALALSAPQVPVPKDAWTNIAAAIAPVLPRENIFSFARLNWLTGGLAVAVFLAAVFGIQSLWLKSAGPEKNFIAQNSGPVESSPTNSSPAPENIPQLAVENLSVSNSESVATAPGKKLETASARVVNPLPAVANAASAVREPLRSASGDSSVRRAARLSAPMQRAVLVALARQLGLTNDTIAAAQNPPPVDFVDLPNVALNGSPTAALTPLENFPPVDLTTLSPNAGGDLPMFTADNNLVVTIDPATLPADAGPVTVWELDADGNQNLIGNFNLGANPTVVTITNADLSGALQYFVLIGGTNVLGRFPQPVPQ